MTAPTQEPPVADDDYAAFTPPHDTTAERAVLGSVMLSTDALADVTEIIEAGDFYRPAHQTVYEAIERLFARGEVIDVITVTDELAVSGDLRRIGGHAFLHDLVAAVPVAANAAYYANIVRDLAALRRLVEAGTRIVQMGQAREGSVEDIINAAQAEVFAVTARAQSEDYVPMSGIVEPTLNEIEAASLHGGAINGVATGLVDLDELTHGFQPGQMIIVAARPALGKSTLALDVARHAAFEQRKCAVIFSLEMSRTEIGMRTISAEAQIPLHHLRKGTLADSDWGKITSIMARLNDAPLYVDDTPGITMAQIRTKCRRLKASNNLAVIIIDYLQLMTSGKRVESRQQEVSEFSRACKLLAKELDVPVIVVAQLNRGPEQRTNKKPQMADLRESGSLEQDADMVILIHRPDLGDPDSMRVGEADLIVAKHRNGPTRDVTVVFQGHYSRFANMAQMEV